MNRTLRICAVFLAISFALTACGGGGGSSSFLGAGSSGGGGSPSGAANGNGNVKFTLTIPAAGSSATTSSAARIVSSAVRKPQTISPATASITVSVNGGPPQIFNVSSCTGSPNLTCVLSVGASYGLDSFLILTWSGANGTGTTLNAAAVTINVTSGGPNTASATAGNVLTVNSSGDGSGGSNSCAAGSTTCTLREAVAEASTTAGVYTALLFTGVTSITVGSPIMINNQNMIIIGPGALAANTNASGAPTAAGNLTISGGGSSQIFHVTAGSLAVDGVTLTGGVAGTSCAGEDGGNCGGAIENYGTLSIVNSVLSANGSTGTEYGGAVFDESPVGATSSIVYSTFTGNKAQQGGGYFLEEISQSGGGAAFSHCVFTGNVASDGSSYGYGGALYADWNLSVNASTFTSNIAGSGSAGGFYGEGGAIDIEDNSSSPTIANSTFGGSASTGNFAGGAGPSDDGYGGAVYNDGGYPLASSGNTFANNTAKGGDHSESGAIDDETCEGITTSNDTFTTNVADSSASGATGEALAGVTYVCGPSTFTNDTFTSNQALTTSSGYAEGGAIYANSAPITVSQTTLTQNTASGGGCDGGALYAYDRNGDFMTLTNTQITSNSCIATGSSNAYGAGGGLEIDFAFITFQNVTVSGNTLNTSAGSSNSAYGGGFAWYDGDFTGGCGKECSKARRPSPVLLARPTPAQSRANLIGMLQTRSTQARARALAIRAVKGRHRAGQASRHIAATRSPQLVTGGSTMTTVTFSNNTVSAGSGGSAYGGGADLSGAPTITAATFSQNTVSASGSNEYAAGGGFSVGSYNSGSYNYGNITFTGTISNNSATNGGGGIYTEGNRVTVENSTISGNSVTAVAYGGDGGGGIWNGDALNVSGTTMTGNSVAGSVTSAGGGAIVTYYFSNTTVLNSTLYQNTSSVDGGAIENVYWSTTNVQNATVYQNTATGNGGGLSNDPDGAPAGDTTMQPINSIIAGNTAANGSDIWNLDVFNDEGYNLVQQIANCGSGGCTMQGSDIIGQSPALASGLGSNGGPTQTIADTSSSPGKGYIPFGGGVCNTVNGSGVDQRGYARGAGGVCDVGAYEFSGTAAAQSKARRP